MKVSNQDTHGDTDTELVKNVQEAASEYRERSRKYQTCRGNTPPLLRDCERDAFLKSVRCASSRTRDMRNIV